MTNYLPAGRTQPPDQTRLRIRQGNLTVTELLAWADTLEGLGPHTLIPALARALRAQVDLVDRAYLLLTHDERLAARTWRADVDTTWEAP